MRTRWTFKYMEYWESENGKRSLYFSPLFYVHIFQKVPTSPNCKYPGAQLSAWVQIPPFASSLNFAKVP